MKEGTVMLAPAITLLAALAQSLATPALELRVGRRWVTWRHFVPGAAAVEDTSLRRAMRWVEERPGLRLGSFAVRTAGRVWTNSVALLEIDPSAFRFELAAAPGWERRTAADWMKDTGVVAAVNTGLFTDSGTPHGLVLMDGARLGGLASWLDALVVIDSGMPRLVSLPHIHMLGPAASAFQTLPWLVRDGRVVFGTSSGRRLSRTHRDRRLTLCLGPDGLVRILLSNFEVFGQTAGQIPVGLTIPEQATIAAAAGCRDAVALDGGISAQLVVRGQREVHRMPGWRRVPLVMLVRPRTTARASADSIGFTRRVP